MRMSSLRFGGALVKLHGKQSLVRVRTTHCLGIMVAVTHHVGSSGILLLAVAVAIAIVTVGLAVCVVVVVVGVGLVLRLALIIGSPLVAVVMAALVVAVTVIVGASPTGSKLTPTLVLVVAGLVCRHSAVVLLCHHGVVAVKLLSREGHLMVVRVRAVLAVAVVVEGRREVLHRPSVCAALSARVVAVGAGAGTIVGSTLVHGATGATGATVHILIGAVTAWGSLSLAQLVLAGGRLPIPESGAAALTNVLLLLRRRRVLYLATLRVRQSVSVSLGHTWVGGGAQLLWEATGALGARDLAVVGCSPVRVAVKSLLVVAVPSGRCG